MFRRVAMGKGATMTDDQTPEQKLQHWRDKFAELANTLPNAPLDQLTAEQLAELQEVTETAARALGEKAGQWWNWQSSDGMVQADIDSVEDDPLCQIFNIVALEQRKGHGRRALQELRAMYSTIRVIGIGSEGNPNRPFWFKMAREGLVDEMLDIDGNIEWPVTDSK
jgi:hypothetical protein